MTISILEFEQSIIDMEEIIVVIRADTNDQIDPYPYERKASGNQSLSEWIAGRLAPAIGGRKYKIIDGSFNQPHGRTKMATLRASYER